jgi:DUF2905 family protein
VESTGKLILLVGVALLVIGGVIYLVGRLGVGPLPGDIAIRRGNLRIFIPIGTSILLSIILSVVLNLLIRR